MSKAQMGYILTFSYFLFLLLRSSTNVAQDEKPVGNGVGEKRPPDRSLGDWKENIYTSSLIRKLSENWMVCPTKASRR